jgi:hypothetical protein
MLSRIVSLASGIAAIALFSCGGGEPKDTTKVPPPPPVASGRATAEIRISPSELGLNQTYYVVYQFHNRTGVPIRVLRIEANRGTIAPPGPNWRETTAEPGKTIIVAQMTAHATTAGTVNLTATFVTDRGSYEALPVKLTVAGPAPSAKPGVIRAAIQVRPNPVQPGQTASISYELTDSTSEDIRVASIQTDSEFPITADNPAWNQERVPAYGKALIARGTLTKSFAGSYPLRARFNTSKGAFDAPPVTLVVVAPPPEEDTGQVTAAIAITPNPCPVDANYAIDYQIINTTRKDVSVTSVSTDIGILDPSRPEWLTGAAPGRRITAIARVSGAGGAISSRTKTAAFSTSQGSLVAPSVVFVVQ